MYALVQRILEWFLHRIKCKSKTFWDIQPLDEIRTLWNPRKIQSYCKTYRSPKEYFFDLKHVNKHLRKCTFHQFFQTQIKA